VECSFREKNRLISRVPLSGEAKQLAKNGQVQLV